MGAGVLVVEIYSSFRKILNELKRLQAPSALEQKTPAFPGLIAAGPEGSILVNEEIEKEIRVIADWLRDHRPATKAQYRVKEWRAAVRKAFGPALMQIDLDFPVEDNSHKLKKLIEATVDATQEVIALHFTTIGCTLFEKPLVGPLAIGPVLFEPKDVWLNRARESGQLSGDNHSRLKDAFAGHPLPKAPETVQHLFERTIVDALLQSQLVCTVETRNFAPEMTKTRAIVGARLGQAAIALLWQLPSKTLEGFHLSVDHGRRLIRTVPYVPGKQTIGGLHSVGTSHGPSIESDDWDRIVVGWRNYFDVAGRMIACWTDAHAQASDLLRNMAAALWFIWEGCRDENDLMAVVKFTSALEQLSQGAGGKSGGIMRLAAARLGLEPNDKIAGEKTLKQVVELIYSDARSRTLHGNNPFLNHDWSEVRVLSESLTRHCLVACMDWFEQNPTATDPKCLVA